MTRPTLRETQEGLIKYHEEQIENHRRSIKILIKAMDDDYEDG